MKSVIAALLIVSLTAFLFACVKKTVSDSEIAGKTYVWEKEGFGGDFEITLQNDGTYLYSTGALSSYIGTGTWTAENGILTLKDTTGFGDTFRFSARDGELVFLSDGSDRFRYITVENGDRFFEQLGEKASRETGSV